MVLVTWDQETGELKEVQQGDGPGEYTDDVDADTVKKRLRDVDSINEEIIAGVIMSAYDGRLMEFSYQATVDTFENSPNSDIDGGRSVTTIGFVEVCDEESKLDLISCDSCDYSPSSANEWIFDIREASSWIYHDWVCPSCDEIAYTELVHVPEDEPLLRESA